MIGYDDMDMIVEILENRTFVAAAVRANLAFWQILFIDMLTS